MVKIIQVGSKSLPAETGRWKFSELSPVLEHVAAKPGQRVRVASGNANFRMRNEEERGCRAVGSEASAFHIEDQYR